MDIAALLGVLSLLLTVALLAVIWLVATLLPIRVLLSIARGLVVGITVGIRCRLLLLGRRVLHEGGSPACLLEDEPQVPQPKHQVQEAKDLGSKGSWEKKTKGGGEQLSANQVWCVFPNWSISLSLGYRTCAEHSNGVLNALMAMLMSYFLYYSRHLQKEGAAGIKRRCAWRKQHQGYVFPTLMS